MMTDDSAPQDIFNGGDSAALKNTEKNPLDSDAWLFGMVVIAITASILLAVTGAVSILWHWIFGR